MDLAKKIKRVVDENPGAPNYYYANTDSIKDKIQTVAREYTEQMGLTIQKRQMHQYFVYRKTD